jgi:hypothetical protein
MNNSLLNNPSKLNMNNSLLNNPSKLNMNNSLLNNQSKLNMNNNNLLNNQSKLNNINNSLLNNQSKLNMNNSLLNNPGKLNMNNINNDSIVKFLDTYYKNIRETGWYNLEKVYNNNSSIYFKNKKYQYYEYILMMAKENIVKADLYNLQYQWIQINNTVIISILGDLVYVNSLGNRGIKYSFSETFICDTNLTINTNMTILKN